MFSKLLTTNQPFIFFNFKIFVKFLYLPDPETVEVNVSIFLNNSISEYFHNHQIKVLKLFCCKKKYTSLNYQTR